MLHQSNWIHGLILIDFNFVNLFFRKAFIMIRFFWNLSQLCLKFANAQKTPLSANASQKIINLNYHKYSECQQCRLSSVESFFGISRTKATLSHPECPHVRGQWRGLFRATLSTKNPAFLFYHSASILRRRRNECPRKNLKKFFFI